MRLLIALVLLLPALAGAQTVITEIMYDLPGADAGREWIEVYNAGSASVPLAEWALIENGKKHKIAEVSGGTALGPGAYAVVADNAEKFKIDHPQYAGLLFDSAFSLSNTGEILALKDPAGAESGSVSYASSAGGNGTGDSLQLTESGFMPGMPTPGASIPAGGLVQAPQVPKSPKSKKASAPSAVAAPAAVAASAGPRIEGTPQAPAQVAMAAADPSAGTLAPFFGVGGVAAFAAAGIILARRARRGEWEIEEMA